MHSLVSASAVPSFHKDVVVGSLLTAMHKYGPDVKCHQLENAEQIKHVLRQVAWIPQASSSGSGTLSQSQAMAVSSNNTHKLDTKRLESTMQNLSKQMKALSTSIETKIQPVKSSAAKIPDNHIVIPAKEMQELLTHLEEIRTAPIELDNKESDFVKRAKALQTSALEH